MSGEHQLRDLLHDATHRVPGVPAHAEHVGHPAGHHGRALQNRPPRNPAPQDRAPLGGTAQTRAPQSRSLNHSPARQPRVLVGWQRRIALFFGQQL